MENSTRIASIERATHRSWDEWLIFMQTIHAIQLNHHDIARKVSEELEGKIANSSWWAQSVAVTYEQYIGRREPGQRVDGTFQANISRTTQLAMTDLMDKWVEFAKLDSTTASIISSIPRVSSTDRRIAWRAKSKMAHHWWLLVSRLKMDVPH